LIPKVKPEWKKISEFYLSLIEKERAEDDLILEVTRDSGFVMDIRDWRASEVQEMNAQQEAWYLRLLGWAWLNGRPQGTVPDDLDKIKKIVKYEEQLHQLQRRLKKFIKTVNLNVDSQNTSSIDQNVNKHKLDLDIHEVEKIFNLELELAEVWSKFSLIEGLPGVRHNKKLTKMLMKRLFIKQVKSKAGKLRGHLKNKSRTTFSIVPNTGDSQVDHKGNATYVKHVMHTPTLTPTPIVGEEPFVEEDPSTYVIKKDLEDLRNSGVEDSEKENSEDLKAELTLFEGAPEKLTKAEAEEKRLARESQELFNYWFEKMNRKRIVLDDKRKRIIRGSLKNFSLADLKLAVDGCALSDYHMGRQPGHPQKHNDITSNICKDASHVEMFIGYTEVNLNGNGTRRGVGDRADELKRQLQEEWEIDQTDQAGGESKASADPAADRPSPDDDDDLPPLISE